MKILPLKYTIKSIATKTRNLYIIPNFLRFYLRRTRINMFCLELLFKYEDCISTDYTVTLYD